MVDLLHLKKSLDLDTCIHVSVCARTRTKDVRHADLGESYGGLALRAGILTTHTPIDSPAPSDSQ